MAGGIHDVDGRKSIVLTAGSGSAPATISAIVLCGALLTACAENAAQPPPAPAPTLAVVTATPGPPPKPTPGELQRYTVQEGDTLSGIAVRFGVSEDAILEENPLSNRDQLFVGQELIIPPSQP